MVPGWGWNAKYIFQTHRHGMLKTAFSKSAPYLIHVRGAAAWRRKPSFAKGRAKGRARPKQTPARRRLSVSLAVRQMEQRTIPAFYCWWVSLSTSPPTYTMLTLRPATCSVPVSIAVSYMSAPPPTRAAGYPNTMASIRVVPKRHPGGIYVPGKWSAS